MTDRESLHDRLGGRDAIATVVDRFYDRVLADERLERFFEDTDTAELRAHQVQFLSSVAGGPVEYSGADMETAHDHLGIDHEAFDIVAGHLRTALEEAGVADGEIDEVLEAVEGYRSAVVSSSTPDSSSTSGSNAD